MKVGGREERGEVRWEERGEVRWEKEKRRGV